MDTPDSEGGRRRATSPPPAVSRVLSLALWSALGAICLAGEPGAPERGLPTTQADAPSRRPLTDLKQPTAWLSWGFDFRFRNELLENVPSTPGANPDSDSDYLRLRPRLWTTLSPTTNVSWNTRLVSEPRYYFEPSSSEGWANEEGLLDLFNLQLTNLFSQPLGLVAGRQEFNFGDRRLIWDGSQADGSRTEFFDAARMTFAAEPLKTVFDAIYIYQDAETTSWLPVLNEQNEIITEQDEQAGILYARNRSLAGTQLDGYLIYRHQERASRRGNEGDLWATGVRADGSLGGDWRYKAELTPEWGRLNGQALQAWGFNSQVSYEAGGSWHHRVRAGYEFLSGDDPDTGVNEGWDPFWARRAQWSELMVYRFGEEYRGRPADYKNLHRLSVGWTANPTKVYEVSLDYMPLFAPEPPPPANSDFNPAGSFRGHYVAVLNTLKFNRYWSGLLRTEFFWPGDYYAEPYRLFSMFVRAEITFKF